MTPDPEIVTPDLPKPVAFVMGGGASLGAAQVGMLQALAEHDITPDLIVGTSVGALNGAFLANDPAGGATRLSHIWPTITKRQILLATYSGFGPATDTPLP